MLFFCEICPTAQQDYELLTRVNDVNLVLGKGHSLGAFRSNETHTAHMWQSMA